MSDKESEPEAGSSRERDCGCRHLTVEDAMDHAFRNIGGRLEKPLFGTKVNKLANAGKVIGFQSEDGRVRVRLDFAPCKGLHVNEEDYTRATHLQKVVHLIERVADPMPGNAKAEQMLANWQENRMLLYWNKWTKRY